MTDLRVERAWTGTHVTYTLDTPLGPVEVDAASLRDLEGRLAEARRSEAAFVIENKAAANPPTDYGMVPVEGGPRWAGACYAPQATVAPEAPMIQWSTTEFDGSDAGWHLILNLRNYGGGLNITPPIATAAWDNPAAVADLCRLVRDPEACLTLFGLTQGHKLAAHRKRLADAAEKAAKKAIRDALVHRNQSAWGSIGPQAEVKRKQILEAIKATSLDDTLLLADLRIRMVSMPLDPDVLLRDPAMMARSGFNAPEIIANQLVGGHAKDNHQYSSAGWRITLVPAEGVTSINDTESLLTDWQDRLQAALTSTDVTLINRPDGTWLVRDTEVFDVLHTTVDPAAPTVIAHLP